MYLSKFRHSKPGDKVFCLINGWGKITAISEADNLIGVAFEDATETDYDFFGRYYPDSPLPVLYFNIPTITGI